MKLLLFTSVLLTVSCLPLVTTSQADMNILNLCVDKYSREKTVMLKCQGRSQIVHVDVKLGNGTCSTVSDQRCYGQTASFLVEHFNCYWKNECVINWPYDTIVTPEEQCNVVGSHPEFMQISYKCFEVNDKMRKTLMLDICGESSSGCTTEKLAEPWMAGIIRSHKLYPWDYPETYRKCTLKIFFPVEKGIQKLIVRLFGLDLSENDTLSILTVLMKENIGETREITAENYKTDYYGRNLIFDFAKTVYVNFSFSVGAESNSGKGFVICFKFINKDDPVSDDVCADITKPGNIGTKESATLGPTRSNVDLNIVTTPKPEMPKKCAKKRSEEEKIKCAERHAKKMANKNGGKGNKKDRKNKTGRKKRNNNRKKRHHHTG